MHSSLVCGRLRRCCKEFSAVAPVGWTAWAVPSVAPRGFCLCGGTSSRPVVAVHLVWRLAVTRPLRSRLLVEQPVNGGMDVEPLGQFRQRRVTFECPGPLAPYTSRRDSVSFTSSPRSSDLPPDDFGETRLPRTTGSEFSVPPLGCGSSTTQSRKET